MRKILLLLILAAPCAWAGNQIDFVLGRAKPQSNIQANGSSERTGSQGTAWSVDLMHQNTGAMYLGIGGGYFHSGDNWTPSFTPPGASSIASNTRTIMLLTRFNLTSNQRWTPYTLAGVGWVRNALMIHDSAGNALLDDARSTYGYAFGAGMDVAMTDRLIFGFEARFQDSLHRKYDLTPVGQTETGITSLDAHFALYLLSLKVGIRY